MLRFGILGAGHFAEAHLEALGRLADRAQVLKVARRHTDLPFLAASAVGGEMVSPEALLASGDVDAVSICLPNNLHRPFAEQALRAGKHVFCEKPLAMSVEDADAVIRTAAQTGRVLMVGHLTRHMPVYNTVADVLASGRLGAPRAVYASRLQVGGGESWRMDPEVGGGVPFDLLVHDFDLLTWYLGRPASVTARGHRRPQAAYDHLAAIFTYPDGALAVAEGSFLLRPGAGLRSSLRVVCARGHVEVNTTDTECPIRVFEEGQPEERVHVDLTDVKIAGIAREFEEFIDAAEGNVRGILRPEDARQAVECAALATRAADTGEEVRFD